MFTEEELQALFSIIDYACKDLTTEDEPLLYVLHGKVEDLLLEQKSYGKGL